MKRLVALCALVAFVLALAPTAFGAGGNEKDTFVQLLAINDFHGNLQPPTGSAGRIATGPGQTVDAGGVQYLATWIKSLRTTNPNTITVGAGDLIGASPLISGLFHDEPTIESMNAIGLDVTGVGNHEFDEGVAELLRMQFGNQLGGNGCHPVDGCQDGTPFGGALFQYLAANVFYEHTENTILPPYEIRKVGNAKIAFIGLTLEGTPLIVTPAGVAGLEFRPEIGVINNLVADLRANQGVRAFVVLIHQGGQQNAPFPLGYQDSDRCDNFTGDIIPIVNGLSPQVDVVVSAHTHQPYICRINGKLVTSAASFGRLITDIDLRIDHQTKDIESATAHNVIVRRDVAERRGSARDHQQVRRSLRPDRQPYRRLADGRHDPDDDIGRRVRARRRDRRRTAGLDVAGGLRRRGRGLHEPGRHPGRSHLQQSLQHVHPGECHLQPALHRAAVQQRHDGEDDDRRHDLPAAGAAVHRCPAAELPDPAGVRRVHLQLVVEPDPARDRRVRGDRRRPGGQEPRATASR